MFCDCDLTGMSHILEKYCRDTSAALAYFNDTMVDLFPISQGEEENLILHFCRRHSLDSMGEKCLCRIKRETGWLQGGFFFFF